VWLKVSSVRWLFHGPQSISLVGHRTAHSKHEQKEMKSKFTHDGIEGMKN
jgi:hypothetical protein